MYMLRHHIQSQIFGKIFGDVADGFFGNFISFGRNVIEHTVCEYVDGLLQPVTEIIQVCDGLQRHNELVIDFQHTVTGGSSLNGCPGQQRGQLQGA